MSFAPNLVPNPVPNIDIDPKNNYYDYVNGNWLKETQIPLDKARYGTFNILHDRTEQNVKILLDNIFISQYELVKNNNIAKLGLLYEQGLKKESNTFQNECLQITHFNEIIDNCETSCELFLQITNIMCEIGISSPFDLFVSSDYDDPKMNILHITSSGLGLPDRDYYVNDTEKNIKIREQYKEFLVKYCKLFKNNFDIDKIYELERQLALKTYSKEDKRNIDKTNNPMHWDDFEKKYSNLFFMKFIFEKTSTQRGKINLSNLEYFKFLNSFVTQDLQTWKEYFKLKFILDIHPYLSEEVDTLVFDFYGKIIKGLKEKEPIWKRSIKVCEEYLGELIGKLYTNKYFPKSTKARADELVVFIKNQLNTILKENKWMEESTKLRAIEKLNKMKVKIGYPDKLEKNYDNLTLKLTNTYLDNILACKRFVNQDHLSYLYKNVNFNKWYMNAHNVNAYYAPNMNDIVFPAGILQEPFFSEKQDAAYNFGGIGSVIGHEITHGFDDEGRRFDGDGLLSDWWTPKDIEEYNKRTKIIVDQYSKYSPLNNNNMVNGHLTLGENIADIGGVYIAYYAYMSYLQKYPDDNKEINSFTPSQRFFMNYANVWKNKSRDENTNLMLVVDPHSPPIFRVNGALKNIDEFYSAYNIKEGDAMFISSEKRAKIWSL